MFAQKSVLRGFSVLLVVMILIGSAAFPTSVRAASIVVNSLADTKAIDSSCTLREAIENANNNAATNIDCTAGSGADTITFNLSGTITLGSTLPTISDAAGLTIDGTGQTVTISGNNVVQVAKISSSGGISLTLNKLTIANGKTDGDGGGIWTWGSNTLTITNSTFSGNSVNSGKSGGGIFNLSGTVTITNSVFSNNSATMGSGGGIANNYGALTITNSTFSGNSVPNGKGGAIYNTGSSGMLTITNSTFSGNSANGAGGLGGGIYSEFYSALTITNSTFSGNSANYGNGGGIYNNMNGALTITNSTFFNNSAGLNCGGIYNEGPLTIANSTFTGNKANGGSGGGIYNNGSYTSSTVTNSSFSSNSASGNGGGFYNYGTGTLVVTNSTFSGNSASGSGGGVNNAGDTLTLRNTIVANSASGGNCGGTITNGANNIDSGTTCGWGAASGSMSSTNPLLGALTGSPAYFPLNVGSPAIDKGDDSICSVWPVNNQSQNGVIRPQGSHCDIGSFEKPITINSSTFTSNMTQDGWILESSETSNRGGTLNSSTTTLRLGDDAARKQYRSVLSFNTSSLPNNAVITKVTLKVKRQGIIGGGNPVTAFQGFVLDVRKGTFGASALQVTDWQANANKAYGPYTPTLTGGWYTFNLTSAKAYINKLATGSGLTQIRLRFKLDDNNNAIANYLSLFSGNAGAASRPQLIIEYYVP